MRVFLYGMQSSGASLATYLLGQTPDSVVLVDLYSYELMPFIEAPGARHVIGKAVITTTHSFEDHVGSFRPDRTILLLRDPVQNYVGLSRKPYRDDEGALDDKFRRLNDEFCRRERFDLVLKYEDVVADPEAVVAALRGIGFPATPELYAFPRTREEITKYNLQHSAWCRERFGRGWSFGNIQGDRMQPTLVQKVVPREVQERVAQLCPDLVRFHQSNPVPLPPMVRTVALARDLVWRPIAGRAGKLRRGLRKLAGSVLRSFREATRS